MYQESTTAICYEDFANICRFCLAKAGSPATTLNPLFDDTNESLTKTLSGMINSCLGIQINIDDDLPSHICSICLKKLLNSNAFRKQSISSEYYLNKVKQDINERKLLREIEERLQSENQYDIKEEEQEEGKDDEEEEEENQIELIEFIDENFEDDNGESSGNGNDSAHNDKYSGDACKTKKEYAEFTVELCEEDDDDDEGESMAANEYERYDDGCDETNGNSDSGDETCQLSENYTIEPTKPRKRINNRSAEKTYHRDADGTVRQLGRRTCPICGKMVVNLKPHVDTHEEFEKRRHPYKCSYCGKEYLQRAQFDGHVNKEHTGLKPFKCEQAGCGRTFHGRPSLRMHKIQHTKERRFKCEFCDKSYLYAHHLSHHRYTHTQKRKFPCKYCDYTNVHMENLKRHILSKHTKQQDKPYQCEVCSRSFNGRSNLQRHIKYVHNSERLENKPEHEDIDP